VTICHDRAIEFGTINIHAPSTIRTERRENDCSGINLSWIPSVAGQWWSGSTQSRSPASNVLSRILASGFCGVFTRSGNASVMVRGFPSWRLVLLPKRQPPRHWVPAERAALLGLVAFDVSLTHSRTDAMAFVVGMKQVAVNANTENEDYEGKIDSSERR
jgi:hypothetical protein